MKMELRVVWLGLVLALSAGLAVAQTPEAAGQVLVGAARQAVLQGQPVAGVLDGNLIATEPPAEADLKALAWLLQAAAVLGGEPLTTTPQEGATAVAVPLRAPNLVMKQVEGQWRVDLGATLAALPPEVRQRLRALVSPPQVRAGNDLNFPGEVLIQPGPVVVFFYTTTCGLCAQLKPIYERLSAEYAGKLRFVSVNAPDSPQTAATYGVTGVPLLAFFRGGQPVAQVGPLPTVREAEVRAWLEQQLTPE